MQKNSFQAVSDRIFVQLDEQDSSSHLILTDYPRPRNRGTVISIGPLVHSVHVGDRVLFHIFDELPSYDENIVVIREDSLLGCFSSQPLSDTSVSDKNLKTEI